MLIQKVEVDDAALLVHVVLQVVDLVPVDPDHPGPAPVPDGGQLGHGVLGEEESVPGDTSHGAGDCLQRGESGSQGRYA